MRRTLWITTIYALFAALVVAAPLAASEELDVSGDPAAPQVEPTPVPPPADVDAPPADEEAPPAPAPAETAPAAPAEPAAAPEPEPQPAPLGPEALPDPEIELEGAASAELASAKRSKRKAGDRPKATAAASATVTISDFKFTPAAVTVNVGDSVTWSNAGPTAHSATASDGSFDTGIYGEGESRSQTFDQAGTFAYMCTPHPQMQGTVTVQAATAGGDDGAADDSPATGDTQAGAESDDGPALPATGLDTSGLLILGLATLMLGAYLRRTTG